MKGNALQFIPLPCAFPFHCHFEWWTKIHRDPCSSNKLLLFTSSSHLKYRLIFFSWLDLPWKIRFITIVSIWPSWSIDLRLACFFSVAGTIGAKPFTLTLHRRDGTSCLLSLVLAPHLVHTVPHGKPCFGLHHLATWNYDMPHIQYAPSLLL